jgi:hypothetical protein
MPVFALKLRRSTDAHSGLSIYLIGLCPAGEKDHLRFKIRIASYVFRPTNRLFETAVRTGVQYLNSSLATRRQLASFLNTATSL